MAVRSLAGPSHSLRRLDIHGASVWLLTFALIVYVGLKGGGYDLVVRNQVGIAVWWAALAGALFGLLPVRGVSRSGWAAVGALAAFVAWTAIATTSGQSVERGLDELSRVACYLGVFVLALSLLRDRERAVRLVVGAVASAIVLVAALALLSRLRPGTFSAAQQTAAFLPGTEGRLDWPLNYWNALAALMALGLPLLLGLTGSARTLPGQAAAAAGIPVVALCGYLTFSRGGALAAACGTLVYFAFTSERIPKLFGAAIAAASSGVLVVGAIHRRAVEDGLTNQAAQHQGRQLLVAVVLVCAGAALAQMALGLAVRHATPPRLLTIPRRRARDLLLIALALLVVVALVAGVPRRLNHAWQDFKRPTSVALQQNALGRFGATSGNGRYDYWRVAVHASGRHLLVGWGPGTFQYVWLSRAPYWSYVRNAHSLYIETLLEDGLIGLVFLTAFFLVAIGAPLRLAVRSQGAQRVAAAAVAGACVTFAVSAAVDWVWQVPVLPIAFLLLVASVLAPARPWRGAGRRSEESSRWGAFAVRGALVVVSVAALAAIAIPLAENDALRQSQAAAAAGDRPAALREALTAARIEPSAAGPQLQSALVYELEGDFRDAVAAARRATTDEPMNWGAWLVLSRLEGEDGRATAAVTAFARARTLNPHSPLFAQ